MKGDTLLDYAEFRLKQTRTRCELYVSADGLTERLASGFLKPFLTHLRAAEEQVDRGCQTIRLERPLRLTQQQHESWFTKGTLERFVRFVSTPEILERVRIIEDELTQLQQVRDIQANSLTETEDRSLNIKGATTPTDDKALSGLFEEKNGAPIMSRSHPLNITNNGAETSKKELLRAMDVRLLALQQEQLSAFARAAAAGFDSDNMIGLMAFSEYYGAGRLREACMQFNTLLKRREKCNLEPEERGSANGEASSSGSDMSLASGAGADSLGESEVSSHLKARKSYNAWFNAQKGIQDSQTGEASTKELSRIREHENAGTNGGFSTRILSRRRKWGPPEKLQADYLCPEATSQEEGMCEVTPGNEESFYSPHSNDQLRKNRLLDESSSVTHPNFKKALDGASALDASGITDAKPFTMPLLSTLSRSLHKETDSAFSADNMGCFLQHTSQQKTSGTSQFEQHRSEAASNSGMFYSQLHQMSQKIEARRAEGPRSSTQSTSSGFSLNDEPEAEISETMVNDFSVRHGSANGSPESNSPSSRPPLGDHTYLSPSTGVQSHFELNKNLPQRSSSPKRRSASPLRRVQIGRSGMRRSGSVVIRSINYFPSQERGSMGKSSSKELESSDNGSEDNNKDDNQDSSAIEPARRLSVQDAISLFESKRRNPTEAPLKRSGKPGNGRGSTECENSSVSGKAVLRRWSGGNHHTSELGSHLEGNITSQGLGVKDRTGLDALKRLHEENAGTPTDGRTAGLGDAAESQYQPLAHQPAGLELSCGNNTSCASSRVWQQSQHSASARFSNEAKQCSEGDPSHVLEEDRQKQFKVELAKSLTRDAKHSDLANIIMPSRSEEELLEVKKRPVKGDPNKSTEKCRSEVSQLLTNVNAMLEQQKVHKSNKSLEQQLQDSPIVTSHSMVHEHVNVGRGARSYSNPEASSHQKVSMSFKGVNIVDNEFSNLVDRCHVKTEQAVGRESFGSSWNTHTEFNMQALVSMVDHHQHNPPYLVDVASPETQRGRLYDDYRKLRDAKLRDEQAGKRADREAKLKAMEETLERRKAEMDLRSIRLSKKSTPLMLTQAQAEKFEVLKAGSSKHREGEKEEEADREGNSLQKQDQTNTYSSPNSPSSTPRALKDQVLTLKPRSAKKSASTFSKSATTPRSSNRIATSSSPRPTPKNLAGTPSGQRRSAASSQTSMADNPLARSVPCFADLRKENTKPSSARTSGSRVYSKTNSSHSGRSHTVSDSAPLEASGNATVRSSSITKEDKKQRSLLTRKSCATVSELKAVSAQGQEVAVLAPIKAQREGVTEPPIFTKFRRSAVAPSQEVKPFLRKGHGIGPGAGPGVMKQKVSTTADGSKNSDEEAQSTPMLNAEVNDATGLKGGALQTTYLTSRNAVDESGGVDGPTGTATASALTSQLPIEVVKQLEEKSVVLILDDPLADASDNDRTCQTISVPIDLRTLEQHPPLIATAGPLLQPSHREVLHHNQDDGQPLAPLSHLLAQSTTDSNQTEASFATPCSSFRASSLPHVTTTFSPAAGSPSSSSMLRTGTTSGHFSPPSAMALDSPLGSPASWNSSQIHTVSEADIARSRKKWGSSQKPVLVINQQPLKEPAKGLKRLLKFGRKSRVSETVTTDWVSASTTSEGDDDLEEPRDHESRSSDDFLRKARRHERCSEVGGTSGSVNSRGLQDQVHSLRSSIPAPPVNFKLRDDHLSGGTLLKAPRSFFSLSTFRSRSSEGKSR